MIEQQEVEELGFTLTDKKHQYYRDAKLYTKYVPGCPPGAWCADETNDTYYIEVIPNYKSVKIVRNTTGGFTGNMDEWSDLFDGYCENIDELKEVIRLLRI